MDHAIMVGAGIGGLTAARLLAAVADRVTLLERAEQPAAAGAGLVVQPNGLGVLAGLGVHEEVIALGWRIERVPISSGARVLLTPAVPDFGAGLDFAVVIRRHDLHSILLQAVDQVPAIHCRFGVAVESADPTGAVVVRSTGGSERLRADLVVGADGVRSAVRASGAFAETVPDRGRTYLRALVEGAPGRAYGEFWTPLGVFGSLPVSADQTYLYAAGYRAPVSDAVARQDLPVLVEAWRSVLPEAGDLLARVPSYGDLFINTVTRIDCRRWADGRVALLGDAAHAMAPNLGQGANSALVDAAVLTEELRSGDLLPALQRYHSRRRRAVRRVQAAADRLADLSEWRHPAAVALRNTAVRAGASWPRLLAAQVRAAQQEEPKELAASVRRLLQPE